MDMDVLQEMWLHAICNFEPETVNTMANVLDKGSTKLQSVEKEIENLKRSGVSADFAERLSEPEYFEQARGILNYCEKNDIRIITRESEDYPEYLTNMELPPRILFAKGERINLNNTLCVAVVGCRKATPHGKEVARQIGHSLAKSGITVVSGMAEGIDAEAHIGALRAGGKTVAVLAGSVDSIYPKSNTKLYYEILKNGMIISERPPKSVVQKYFYRQRNRIVVGVSRGVVVVEGENGSGTSMTVGIATDANRDLFAVPGNPIVKQSQLPNQLIEDGAIMVSTVDRPVEYYKEFFPDFVKTVEESSQSAGIKGANPIEEKILRFISDNGGEAINEEIAEACAIPLSSLNSHLTILAIKGILRQESGNRYILCELKNR